MLLCNAFWGGSENCIPGPVAGKPPTPLDLACERFAGKSKRFDGMMHNGPRDFLAGLAGGPLMNRQGDLLVFQLGLMDALRGAGRDGIHGAKSVQDGPWPIRQYWKLFSPVAILKPRPPVGAFERCGA
jgi:hypothetical protein